MKKTGLSRIQIYKWFFDMKKLASGQRERDIAPEERISYAAEMLRSASGEMLNGDGQTMQPIFRIDKIRRLEPSQ